MAVDPGNPTPQQVRDDVADKLERFHKFEASEGKSPYTALRPVGTDEILLNHPTGRKFVVKVREVEG